MTKKKFELEGRESTIIKVKHDEEHPYLMISRETLEDTQLSFKARGLLFYMLGRPNGWEFNVAHLMKQSDQDGRDAIRSGLRELRKAGYIKTEIIRDGSRFAGSRMVVYEHPQKEPETGEEFDPTTLWE
jgi:hypothetical protein